MRKGKKCIASLLSMVMLSTGFFGIPANTVQAEEIGEVPEEIFVATPLDGEEDILEEMDIRINSVTFPDTVLRAYVSEHFDSDGNGTLSSIECDYAYDIRIMSTPMRSLKGIEYFPNLTHMDVFDNQIESVDLSNNKKLKELNVSCNKLTSINVSQNTALTELCVGGNQLTKLDVSKNVLLQELYVNDNLLRSLDVSMLSNLEKLVCGENLIQNVDVSKNKALTFLSCEKMNLTAVDVSKNPLLEIFWCSDNQIKSLNVSNNPKLTSLECERNNLDKIDIRNNRELRTVMIRDNAFQTIYLTNNVNLEYINAAYNHLSNITFGNNSSLRMLDCEYNYLPTINVTNLLNLEELYCSFNRIAKLDVSRNKKLFKLECHGNGMPSLDVSRNTELKYLRCGTNKLTSINVSNNTKLMEIIISGNKLSTLSLVNNKELEVLDCRNNIITDLNTQANAKLKSLYCDDNELTALDVTKNPNLESFGFTNNKLAHINLTQNAKLTTVNSSNNQFDSKTRSIDLSAIPGLKVTRVSNVKNGTLKGNILTVSAGASIATYTYNCGGGHNIEFSVRVLKKPEMVTDIRTAEQGDYIYVYWAKNEQATRYHVYRRTADTDWEKIGVSNYAGYSDEDAIGGVGYYYTVIAENEVGFSAYDKNGTYGILENPPKEVELYGAIAGKTAIKVEWAKAKSAENYIVYRKDTNNSKWITLGKTNQLSYIDQTAIGGVTYTYTVKAVNANGVSESYNANGVFAQITAKPGEVLLDGIVEGKTALRVNWKKTPTASSYIVYRRTKGENWTRIGTSTSLYYIDQTAVGGVSYLYTVKAVSESGTSETYNTTGVVGKITALPGITTMIGATAYAGYINVQWKATPTASSYVVYRKTSGGNFTKIGTTTKTAYNDKTAVKGKTYYYTVIAVNGNGACKTYDTKGVSATAK